MDIVSLSSIGIAVVALLALLYKVSQQSTMQTRQSEERSVSLREHEEFKTGITKRLDEIQSRQDQRLVIREFDRWRDEWLKQVQRDFDRVEEDLRIIDQTKPSAETLQEAMKAVDARVTHLEEMVRYLHGKADGGRMVS